MPLLVQLSNRREHVLQNVLAKVCDSWGSCLGGGPPSAEELQFNLSLVYSRTFRQSTTVTDTVQVLVLLSAVASTQLSSVQSPTSDEMLFTLAAR